MVPKSFRLTFAHVSEAHKALVSYFKRLGGQPDGKQDSRLKVNASDPSWREALKQGLSLNTSYLIQSLLTVDLRLETCFTIDV